ncbi:MAG: radical SAM protein, partial [Phycisphaerae bacterium]
MANKTVYLETFGCQMNVLDSELVLGQLRRAGYSPTADAQQADLALLNTCSVREHAEQKVYSRLGELGRIKRRRPDLIVGLIGCMAERDAGGIRRRMPHVDVLCGPGRLNELPAMIEQVRATGQPAVAVSGLGPRRVLSAEGPRPLNDIEALDMARQPSGNVTAYVRVQRGCDKFCSFCVVPFVRGPERSRPPANVVEEARRLADAGTRQLTLLGQTINSYAYRHNGRLVGLAD